MEDRYCKTLPLSNRASGLSGSEAEVGCEEELQCIVGSPGSDGLW